MNITDYILRYQEHTEGEDDLYRDVEWTTSYLCPVKDLVPGKDVPFTPDKRLSEPNIKCLSVSEAEVTIEYVGYTGDGRLGLQKEQITLSEQSNSWECYFGGGKYNNNRSIKLIKPEEANGD